MKDTFTDLDQVEMHDALLKSMAVDYVAKSITICVEFYERKNERQRKSAAIIFDQVESISAMNDIDVLQKHTFAGHISDWVPARGRGTTSIYLVGGAISVTAGTLRVEIQA